MIFGILFWLSVFGVFYAYVGYPVLIWLLARFARPSQYDVSYMPSVTLLIAAYNEEGVIGRKIENSLQLNYPREKLQILVMDDGSVDSTQEIIRSYQSQGIELAFNPPRRGKMAAINRAIQQARGDIVLFSDASNLYHPDVVREMAIPFSDSAVGAAVGARSIDAGEGGLGKSEGLYWKYESFIQSCESKLGCCTGIVGEILALRLNLFVSPPDGIINDDFYMAMQVAKQGFKVIYVPTAKSFESISTHSQDGIERRSRIVAGRYQAILQSNRLLPWNRPFVVWQVISHKFMRPLVPFFMAGAILFNALALVFPSRSGSMAILFLESPYNWLLLVLQIIFYMLGLFGQSLEKRNAGWLRALYIPTFLINSNWAAVKGMFRFLSGKQTTLWAKTSKFDSVTQSKDNK